MLSNILVEMNDCMCYNTDCCKYAGVAELADAPDSKSGGGDIVWVQVPSPVVIVAEDSMSVNRMNEQRSMLF